jgi:thiamine biosynthesis lipoprotein
MRRVEQIMGMPISVDIPGCQDEAAFDIVFERFKQIDQKFSTYKPDSEVSRYIRGEIAATSLSDELIKIIDECKAAEAKTNGYFSAWAAGGFDPSGYVKGWAISQAGQAVEAQGFRTYCIGAGGDILGRSNSDKAWNIGIQDPLEPSKILNSLSISNGAVTTSGDYARGAHIINPKTHQPANEFLSVSIVGPDIIWADVLATAVFAMGRKARAFMRTQADYQAIIVSRSGQIIS